MMEDDFIQKEILAVNTANLASNMESVSVNRKLLHSNAAGSDRVIFLLEQILKEVKKLNDS